MKFARASSVSICVHPWLEIFFVILFATLFSLPASAVEPWADKNLSITNGLEIWFDASKEIAARAQSQKKGPLNHAASKLTHGGPLDLWHDGSGNKRNVLQLVPSARPKFFRTASGAFVRFDGVDDFMAAVGLGQEFAETTVFILAAPRTNQDNFSAFLSFNRDGENDFLTGLNIDLGNGAKKKFDFLNVEGPGFVGLKNVMTSAVQFDDPHVISVVAEAGTNDVRAWVDDIAQVKYGSKPRPSKKGRNAAQTKNDATFSVEQITVGARFYSNTLEPAHVQNFLDGDVLEVLIYNRILNDAERSDVEKYLKQKLVSKVPGREMAFLNTVTNPAPVQMFLPGFSARELPVELSNINNLDYREDGKLVALGYDGKIWILSDTDGDGLEDKASLFWDKETLRSPIGMALTPPNYAKGRGVFVPSKGKASLIVDTNSDDVADEEMIVATGWPESSHGVDALGVAVDKDSSIYFGLGTASFTGAYLVDKDGKSHYDLKDERGTIMKVSPDFKTREIICTGIRYPVGMGFNANGDLFCTDQEGATWLPNGNPFDELLFIERGKHYGFPPRRPKYLPNVIDEPSVFDYAPQHESTCGLAFNIPVGTHSTASQTSRKTFGPSWWRGDAFVAGYSRGKIFRTKLVKTDAGYVAQNQLIAALDMLPSDVCATPDGGLLVSVHSGKPDWGSGPTGAGKIYKISYSDKDAPQPVAIWPSSATETRVEFNRPLDVAQMKNLAKKITITQGKYVSAGDSYETIRPGYQAVQNQLLEPRYVVKVLSTELTADGRSLVIRTEPRVEAVNYAISFPSRSRREEAQTEKSRIQNQKSQIDKSLVTSAATIELAQDLTGVEAEWQSSSGEKISMWMPHLDLTVDRAFTKPSAAHEAFWSSLAKPGILKIRTQLNLWKMLRAATQPDSELDFKYPSETVTVVLKSKSPLQVNAPSMEQQRIGENEIHLTAVPTENHWFPLEVALQNSSTSEPALDVSWFTAEDSRRRALPLRRIFLPWAKAEIQTGEKIERMIPEIAGGNWLSGKKLFFGDQTSCSKCHTFGGQGGKIGPDLSNLLQRDYASVMKDITQPSAAINPDHVAYNVELKNEESLSGVLVGSTETESKFADATGKITTVEKSEIASSKPSSISLMPEGLLEPLNAQQRKDLLTYLLMPPPLEPAPIEREGEPPARKMSEVNAILEKSNHPKIHPSNLKPLRIVLCDGPKDHGVNEHDYPVWKKRWSKLFSFAEKVSVETGDKWPTPKQFKKADVIVFYSDNPGWPAEHASALDQFLNRGGGLVYLHYAIDGHQNCEELAQRIGLSWRGGFSKFRHGPIDLNFQPSPITEGFSTTHFVDESYWNLMGSETNIQLLANGIEDGKAQPLMWTREQRKGRVFVSVPGHYTWTFDDPLFRILIFRGIAWTAREPLDRFNDLVTLGARVTE